VPASRSRDDDLGSSPLASAAPATAAPSTRARAGAPARNGAAAYAAEAARFSDVARPTEVSRSPEVHRGSARQPSGGAARPTAETPSRAFGPATAARPADPPVDEARVSELAGLLGAATPEPQTPAYARAYPRTGGVQKATFQKAPWTPVPEDEDDADDPQVGGPVSPSPFTAALARMVAGDSHVRQAVESAVEEVDKQSAAVVSRGEAERRPVRSTPARTADTAVWPRAARQEEETVGDQVIAPPSMPAAQPAEVPTWAAEPEAVAAPDSAREEAIAEILRSALAQGHSDEALAGILRKVLDGATPQAALTEPEPAATIPELVTADDVVTETVAVPVVPAPVVEAAAVEPIAVVESAVVESAVVEPVAVVEPAVVEPAVVEPVATAEPATVAVEAVPSEPVAVEAVPSEPVAVDPPRVADPVAAAEPVVSAPAVDIWGAPASTPLWGEAVTAARIVPADAPIWAEVVLGEPTTRQDAELETVAVPTWAPVVEAPVVESPVVEASTVAAQAEIAEVAVAEVAVADVAVAEPVAAEPVVEAAAEIAVADAVEDTEVAPAAVQEIAPLLARTASDPAPLPMSMSLDVTSVMPPLSLLPPLPSSRGRGRPPVPPATSRPPVPPSRPAAEASAPTTPEVEVAPAAPVTAPPTKSLATVTRLPVAPLMAGPDIPELTEEEIARLENAAGDVVEVDAPEAGAPEVETAEADAPDVETPRAETPRTADAPAVEPAVRPTPVPAAGDVVGRLAALGLPTRLLGAGFAADVEKHGTYAALTRALGLRLPAAPALPSGAGEVLFVVGPGVETLRAARSLAASLYLDADRVQWATRGDLAGIAPEANRMTTLDAAITRRQEAAGAGTVTIVAVDAPMRTDAYWMAQMLAIWSPVAVWAVVEATRKPEDVEDWLDGLSRVDALIVQDTDLSADPAAVLHRVAAPVAVLDGVRATPHRWASLLCERLEDAEA
jgi:hypothetical protein